MDRPLVDLHLIFEKSCWMNLIFGLFHTWILQTTQAVKDEFELNQKSSSSNLIFQKSSEDQQGERNPNSNHTQGVNGMDFEP